MAAARAGAPLRHIGRAVQRRARPHGFSVVTHGEPIVLTERLSPAA